MMTYAFVGSRICPGVWCCIHDDHLHVLLRPAADTDLLGACELSSAQPFASSSIQEYFTSTSLHDVVL